LSADALFVYDVLFVNPENNASELVETVKNNEVTSRRLFLPDELHSQEII
jgi:hypothetical protein